MYHKNDGDENIDLHHNSLWKYELFYVLLNQHRCCCCCCCCTTREIFYFKWLLPLNSPQYNTTTHHHTYQNTIPSQVNKVRTIDNHYVIYNTTTTTIFYRRMDVIKLSKEK
ncbi:hypothetical protein PPL_03187 [Heterostelium album PN500]|uniref:Uncharacterized protein n=1 Tax=Heterostelium pallidum (strain ATCC 26659 / Pp 5 / PN500) TaxID=670386 RepID=D3B466_HETP5|nr:hypothetical protein PPL_03187 [Heterostelium album PN500]EFA84114.1 hypothetical protein PPL_03187 [Heterostelium album PN500]|eukprot:XP_020436231.1 hypothetical protein PPL_03187 [Heterostelium album PN500]